jgi:hypothetical protein
VVNCRLPNIEGRISVLLTIVDGTGAALEEKRKA